MADNDILWPNSRALDPYRRRAIEFARSRYPDDPEMLMAAGLLAEDESAGLRLLKEAAEKADTPATWAAYASRLLEAAPKYERLGTYGVDPGDPAMVSEARRILAEWGVPDRLTEEQAEPLLSATRSWQRADPTNALPAALEAWRLYGLHQDRDAFARWQAAAALPVVSAREQEIARAGARLLSRMGMWSWKAIPTGMSLTSMSRFSPLRSGARIASYEGRLAQIQGRSAEAIASWNSTIAIGRHMQESASNLIEYMVGVAVEGIGAQHAWVWCLGAATGMEDGPLSKGRYFWGPQHQFYVSQVGKKADAELRDHLVKNKLRLQATRGALEKALLGGPLAWLPVLTAAAGAGILLGGLVLLFGAFGSWRRRQADEAAVLSLRWRLITAALTLIPAAAGAALLASAPQMVPESKEPAGLERWDTGMVALAVSAAAALLLPLVAALWTRRAGARIPTAWRGNLRRTLPLSMLLCALLALGLAFSSLVIQRRWASEWFRGSPTEVERVARELGRQWTDPEIPPDSWRAEYPPEVEPRR